MVMQITPVTVNVAQTTPTACDSLYCDAMTINARSRTSPPSAQVTGTPFASNGGNPVYAANSQSFNISNLYAAAAVLPSIATWLAAGEAAFVDLWNYIQQVQANVTAAKTALATAQAAVSSDQSAINQATAALTLAQAQLTVAENAADVATIAASQTAIATAQTALQAASDALATDQASVLAAQAAVSAVQRQLDPSFGTPLQSIKK